MAFDRSGRLLGIIGDNEMNEASYTEAEQQEEEVPQAQKNERRTNTVSTSSDVGATSKIILYEPRVYSDAREVAQNLPNNKTVITNFARMGDEQTRRIVDFIAGTVYALNGEVQRVSDKISLVIPPKSETGDKTAKLAGKKDKMD